ncbi:MAG: hypothetical protein WBA63_10860 [Thermomicrobiales bacterium]
MTDMSNYTASEETERRARSLVAPAIAFCGAHDFPLGSALIAHLWRDAPAQPVLDALATYQNADGGFGNGLEVDIASPVSNPFAARLAMQVLLSLREPASGELVDRLAAWLQTTQNADGDWHFAPEVYESPLAPWFAGLTFPALNPACCVAGLANRLGIATPEMLDRVATLFTEKASLADAEGGEFYAMLPYVEYVPWVDIGQRDTWLDALARGIAATVARGGYDDAGHFFDHALGGGPEVLRRLPHALIDGQVQRLLDEAQDDGGWPTPYDPAWRPHQTAMALVTLAHLRDGI